MPNTTSISCISIICLLFLITAGCDNKNDTRQTPSPEAPASVNIHQKEGVAVNGAAAKPSITFDTVLSCWQQDRKEDAAAAFLSLNWTQSGLSVGNRCLNLSEKQFVGLPRTEQETVSQQAIDLSKSIREMSRYFVEQAKTAHAENRLAEAKKYQDALMEFGRNLSGDDKLLLIQMTGKAVLGYTQKELAER